MSDFEIDFVSDVNSEHLMAEISFRKQRLCRIDKELGEDRMEIEFLSDLRLLPEEVVLKFRLADFEAVIREAVEELRACE